MLPSKSICMRTPIWSFKWRREWDSIRFAVPCSHLRLYSLGSCRPRHELSLPYSAPGSGRVRSHTDDNHVTGFQELKRCSALFRKLNIFCNFTCIFADISPTAVSRNYYSKWENYCQKLKKFHPKSIVPKLQNSPMDDFAVQNAAVIFFRQSWNHQLLCEKFHFITQSWIPLLIIG